MADKLLCRRRWVVPEVVQTSAMDCGPATLKCLLGGYGIPVHYGRLREACQTDLDGTSIDTLETVANRLGLQAEQVMLPLDHLLIPQAHALPAILVVRQPTGTTHFVLVWRRLGPWVQVMDPGEGRRWMSGRQLLADAYLHEQRVPAEAWRAWAGSEDMQAPLRHRLRRLGIRRPARRLIAEAATDPSWRRLACLDAATRLVESLVQAGSLSRGRAARRLLCSLLDSGGGPADADPLDARDRPSSLVPGHFWSVRPCRDAADGGDEQLILRGAVLVRVLGRRDDGGAQTPNAAGSADAPRAETAEQDFDPLGPELAAALAAPDSRPLATLGRLICGAGWFRLLTLLICLVLTSACAVLEAVLLRGILDVGRDLTVVEQRLAAIGCWLLLGLGVLVLDFRIAAGLFRLGRRLETTLRAEFLAKIPRLHDRYFQSRLTSDMAHRGHSMHLVRLVPPAAGWFLRAAATVALTAGAIAWVEPSCAGPAILAAVTAIGLPLAFLPILQGLDLRVRTHAGSLASFAFEALLGLAAIRAHSGQAAVRGEQEGMLVEWVRASQRLLRWQVLASGLQSLTGMLLAAWLLMLHASRSSDATAVLLIAYWALNLPELGEEIARLVSQYPGYRNVTLRLLEPLGAPELDEPGQNLRWATPGADAPAATGIPSSAGVRMDEVLVRAAGHTILQDVSLDIRPASHVAIVGPSGAGKSSLVGLLLGWHRPAAGRLLIDGEPLAGSRLDRLRSQTVWVDPAVQLWNRSLLDNLLYGNHETGLDQVGDVASDADMYDVLQRLPDGLQTVLGEGGGLLSGGEGQRVKLGRGMAHAPPRLVILDEPFRGLERERRRILLGRARRRWAGVTLLCITHDVRETLDFPRVLVLDGGRLVEDGAPCELAAAPDSLYRRLLDAEDSVRNGLWERPDWRHLQLRGGRLEEPRKNV